MSLSDDLNNSNDTIDCPNTGDTAWMSVACVLVLGMAPGLALFEAGLLRAKNTVSLLAQIVTGIMVLSVMWTVVGFSLVYGDTVGGFIGNPATHAFFLNLYDGKCIVAAPNIPAVTFATFEMMFAVITPLLQTGAFAERMKFKTFLVYSVLWEIFVYYPLAHWIWGGGWLSPEYGILGESGVFDFAGGIVIHTSAGASALIVAKFIGRRRGFYENNNGRFPPSNLVVTSIGAAFLWIGWFGFNGGSSLTSGANSAFAIINSQIAAAVTGCIWLFISMYGGHSSVVELLNGAIAGLAGITPASGYITPASTIVLSVILGFTSFYGVNILKDKMKIDDALEVSVVHGLTGVLGSIAVGFAGTKEINPDGPESLISGFYPKQIGIQVLGVLTAAAWSSLWSIIILNLCERTIGVRITDKEESEGLDETEHHEVAYFYLSKKFHYDSVPGAINVEK